MSQHAGLLCPVCRTDLVMSERQGVEIDYCPRCRGVWLDRGELDKILDRSAGLDAAGGAPPGAQPGAAPAGPPPGMAPGPLHDPRYGHGYRPHDTDEFPAYGHGKHKRRKSFLDDLFDFD